MRERINYREIMPWKVLRFLAENGFGTRVDGAIQPTPEERKAVLDQWMEFGDRIDEVLSTNLEPPKRIPEDLLVGVIALILARAGRLPCIAQSSRADFAMQTARCVLHYFGVRLQHNVFGEVRKAIRPIVESDRSNAQVLAEVTKEVVRKKDTWFRHGDAECRELAPLRRFQLQYENRLPVEILDSALSRGLA
jgi:hypothetical protein